jgi:hypothetical protein
MWPPARPARIDYPQVLAAATTAWRPHTLFGQNDLGSDGRHAGPDPKICRRADTPTVAGFVLEVVFGRFIFLLDYVPVLMVTDRTHVERSQGVRHRIAGSEYGVLHLTRRGCHGRTRAVFTRAMTAALMWSGRFGQVATTRSRSGPIGVPEAPS